MFQICTVVSIFLTCRAGYWELIRDTIVLMGYIRQKILLIKALYLSFLLFCLCECFSCILFEALFGMAATVRTNDNLAPNQQTITLCSTCISSFDPQMWMSQYTHLLLIQSLFYPANPFIRCACGLYFFQFTSYSWQFVLCKSNTDFTYEWKKQK